MKTLSDRELLAVFDAIPSLLELANERAKSTGENAYDLQNQLRDELYAQGKVFKWSMAFRSLFECSQCGLMSTRIEHTIFNPVMKDINPELHVSGLSEEDVHHIRKHGAAFSVECRKFLEQVSDQLK